MTLTWNEVFGVFAPLMIEGATQHALKTKLDNFFRHWKEDRGTGCLSYTYVRDEDFQRIKVQLRALGLITNANPGLEGKESLWILTPYGENAMNRVVAVTSGRQPTDDE